jgi:hypothetical protein
MCCLKTLFDIDVENTDVCKVIDAYMSRAWRNYRAKLHDYFKAIEGSKNATNLAEAKAACPDDVGKEDWEYLCDRWSDPKFMVTF